MDFKQPADLYCAGHWAGDRAGIASPLVAGANAPLAGYRVASRPRTRGGAMSKQSADFVNRWEFENVRVIANSKRADEARRLALRCQQDAAKAGISARDLEAAVDGDLIENMRQALDAAWLRQIAVEQWADKE
jgi:hypothetical protein